MRVSPSAIPGGGPEPERSEILARIEVRDAETEVYIPGADVSVIYPGGKVSKKTGIGGDASFSKTDFTGPTQGATYRVEKPGYEPREKPFVENQITQFALPRAKGTAGAPAATPEFPTTTVLAVGGLAAVGLVAFLALR